MNFETGIQPATRLAMSIIHKCYLYWIENSSEITCVIDSKGFINYATPAVQRILNSNHTLLIDISILNIFVNFIKCAHFQFISPLDLLPEITAVYVEYCLMSFKMILFAIYNFCFIIQHSSLTFPVLSWQWVAEETPLDHSGWLGDWRNIQCPTTPR